MARFALVDEITHLVVNVGDFIETEAIAGFLWVEHEIALTGWIHDPYTDTLRQPGTPPPAQAEQKPVEVAPAPPAPPADTGAASNDPNAPENQPAPAAPPPAPAPSPSAPAADQQAPELQPVATSQG